MMEQVIALLNQISKQIDDLPKNVLVNADQVKAITLAELSKNLGLIQAGEFRSGNSKDPGFGFSGIRIGYPFFVYNGEDWNLVGINNDIMQVGISATDGKLYAGGGSVILDSTGITAEGGTIGGWTITDTELSSGSMILSGDIPAILMGSATDYLTGTGIFMGLSSAVYKFHIGNPAGNALSWDGTNLAASGNWIKGAGLNPSLQTWTTTIVFSSASATQVNWTSGNIVLNDGTTYTISSGNTGTMSVLTYIYLDTAVSSTVLQTTTTYSTAVGDGKLLIAAAQNHTVAASVIPYGGQQPIIDGSQITAASIVAGNIAASTITADKLSITSLSAITANMGNLTVDGKLSMAGASSAIAIGTTPPTSASAGTGLWIDKTGLYGLTDGKLQVAIDATDGTLYAGGGGLLISRAGLTINELGSALTINPTDTFSIPFVVDTNSINIMVAQKTGSELITNGDFESGNTTGWTGDVSVTTSNVYAGNYSAECLAGSRFANTTLITIDPAYDYLFSWVGKIDEGETLSGTFSYYTSGDVFILSADWSLVSHQGDWIIHTEALTSFPSSTGKIGITFYAPSGHNCYFDNISLYRLSAFNCMDISTSLVNICSGIAVNFQYGDNDTNIYGTSSSILIFADAGNQSVSIGHGIAPRGILDVTQKNNGFSIIAGADISAITRTDDTSKSVRIGMPQYDTDEEPFTLIYGYSTHDGSAVNILSLGGGTSVGNAATEIDFYAAANGTTTTGTKIVSISLSETALSNLLRFVQGSALTISSGAITVTCSYHVVDTEGAAATDDLTDIQGGNIGSVLVLRTANNARDVTVKDNSVLLLAGDCVLDTTQDTLTLLRSSATQWIELSRSNNA